mmetsp:Transcript_137575/g.239190  ORF Transcript_137575/g.239190 Transcript_137575/m.239190 type:complete len:211 (+) Transcript_137575:60-692(+)
MDTQTDEGHHRRRPARPPREDQSSGPQGAAQGGLVIVAAVPQGLPVDRGEGRSTRALKGEAGGGHRVVAALVLGQDRGGAPLGDDGPAARWRKGQWGLHRGEEWQGRGEALQAGGREAVLVRVGGGDKVDLVDAVDVHSSVAFQVETDHPWAPLQGFQKALSAGGREAVPGQCDALQPGALGHDLRQEQCAAVRQGIAIKVDTAEPLAVG